MDNISDTNKKIFGSLRDLLTTTTFVDARMEFLNAHLNTFDANEENKLEYTGIYESYVQILDQLIDTKLVEGSGFQSADVDAFYVDFAANH